MPRFYFNTVNNDRDRDREGIELADLSMARKEAVRYIGEVLRSDPDMIWDGRDFRIDVTDENGECALIVIAMAIDASAVWPKARSTPI